MTDSTSKLLSSVVCHWKVKNPVQISVDEVIVDKADQVPLVHNAVDELGSRRLFAVQAGPLGLPQLEGLVLQMQPGALDAKHNNRPAWPACNLQALM